MMHFSLTRRAHRPTTRWPALSCAAAALLLAGCDKPDTQALASADAGFAGQSVNGTLDAVASRPVRIGTSGAKAPACAAMARGRNGNVAVRWSASAQAPVKARIGGDVWLCETDGGWSGVVFPASGQDASDCNVDRALRSPTEYQGPCRSGWVESRAVEPVAG